MLPTLFSTTRSSRRSQVDHFRDELQDHRMEEAFTALKMESVPHKMPIDLAVLVSTLIRAWRNWGGERSKYQVFVNNSTTWYLDCCLRFEIVHSDFSPKVTVDLGPDHWITPLHLLCRSNPVAPTTIHQGKHYSVVHMMMKKVSSSIGMLRTKARFEDTRRW